MAVLFIFLTNKITETKIKEKEFILIHEFMELWSIFVGKAWQQDFTLCWWVCEVAAHIVLTSSWELDWNNSVLVTFFFAALTKATWFMGYCQSSREAKKGTEAEAREKPCFLAYSQYGVFNLPI